MLNEVLSCVYVISRVHCALGEVHIYFVHHVFCIMRFRIMLGASALQILFDITLHNQSTKSLLMKIHKSVSPPPPKQQLLPQKVLKYSFVHVRLFKNDPCDYHAAFILEYTVMCCKKQEVNMVLNVHRNHSAY